MKSLVIEVIGNGVGNEYLVEIGESQQENDQLIRKSKPGDLWFHLDKYSGPHIVLHNAGAEIPKRYLNLIGGLFPDYKRGLAKKYTVIYTEISNLKLTKILGTVIPNKTRTIKY
jgi:predicted ribosome quality control (RQC) complex YloA/Tae2 family protein